MKLKTIEHKKYTAPEREQVRIMGKLVWKTNIIRHRKYEQAVEMHVPGVARRFLPLAISPLGVTFPQFDAAVRKNILDGFKEAHELARRRFHPHRPKPANNTAKNKARRMKFTLVLGAQTPGNKPEPAIRMNASQMRLQGMAEHRKRNGGRGSVAKHRRVARKVASRRKHKARSR